MTTHSHSHPSSSKKGEASTESAATPTPTPLETALAFYLAEAKAKVAAQGFVDLPSPEVWQRRGQSAVTYLSQLAELPKPDESRRPESAVLFAFGHEKLPHLGDLAWTTLIQAACQKVGEELTKEGGKTKVTVVLPDGTVTLTDALAAGNDLYENIGKICDGTNKEDAAAKARRERVFGFRPLTRTRDGFITEFGNIAQAIKDWGNDAPRALQLVQPEIARVSAELQTAHAIAPGRKKSYYSYSVGVQEASTALALVLNDLLGHALAVGSKAAKSGFERKLHPKRHGDASGEEPEPTGGDGSGNHQTPKGGEQTPPGAGSEQSQSTPPPAGSNDSTSPPKT